MSPERERRRFRFGRRGGDHRPIYRDLWLALITGLVLVALIAVQHTIQSVRSGRHVAIVVNCAVLSAIADAGRQVITGSSVTTPGEERALTRLGFPPAAERRAAAAIEARAYVASISQAVNRQIDARGHDLIRRDGTIDCARLLAITHAEP